MRIIVFYILVLCSCQLWSQPEEILSTGIIEVKDGLSDRMVIDITSDSLGRYYILTPGAVQVFEGEELVETLTLSNYSQNWPLVESDEYILRMDKNNCVSIITKTPLRLIAKQCIEEIIEGELVLWIDGGNSLQALTKQESNYVFSAMSVSSHSLEVGSRISFSHPHDILAACYVENEGVFFIDEFDNLYRSDIREAIFTSSGPKYPRAFTPQLIVNTTSASFYFSFKHREGVYSYKDGSISQLYHSGFIGSHGVDRKGQVVLGLTGQVYLLTDDVLFIDSDGTPYIWNDLISSNNRTISFYSNDFSKSVVVGTYNGLYYFEEGTAGLHRYLRQQRKPESGFGHIVRSFTTGHNDNIIVVMERGSFTYEMIDGVPEQNDVLTDKFGYGTNWVEYLPEAGFYLIGQYQRDGTSLISEFDPNSKEKHSISLPMTIERFHVTKDYIWATGRNKRDGRVYKIGRKDKAVKPMFENLIKDRNIRASYFTDDYYLFGTRGGLIVYDPFKQTINHSLFEETKDLYVSNIRKYGGQYLIGTYNEGIFRYNSDFKFIGRIDVGEGSAGNTVASIERDAFGNFWVSTFDGLAILDSSFHLIDRIDKDKGYGTMEFNRDASFQGTTGMLYFGNTNGFITIEPEQYFEQILASDFILYQCAYTIDDDRIVLNDYVKDIHIRGRPTEVSLSFISDAFTKKARYPQLTKYNLEIQPSPDSVRISDHSIALSGFHDNTYNIYVRDTRNNHELLPIAILTWSPNNDLLFRTSGIIFIYGTLSFALSRYLINSAKRRNEEQLNLKMELAETKMKALRSQLNPHFIFNSLNSIQYYIQVNEKKLARDYLSKFAKLMRMFLDASHNDTITITNEIEQLRLYLDLEQVRFEGKWKYDIQVDDSIDKDTYVPAMILQPIVENAIIHGLGNLQGHQGELKIQFINEHNGIAVHVIDNGIGREQSKLISIQKSKIFKSLSTSITKERIGLFNNQEGDYISIRYIDKFDNIKPSGTEVIIFFQKNE